jgi:hypothetical protein
VSRQFSRADDKALDTRWPAHVNTVLFEESLVVNDQHGGDVAAAEM